MYADTIHTKNRALNSSWVTAHCTGIDIVVHSYARMHAVEFDGVVTNDSLEGEEG